MILALADTTTLQDDRGIRSRLEILLTDYLVNAISGRDTRRQSRNPSAPPSGICESAGALALDASARDADDIDWTVMTHPGSVIWSSLFATTLRYEESRKNFLVAALAGYRTSGSIAFLFGKSHRVGWHVTTSAGSFAAASTVATALGLSHDQHIRALHCAGATAGGIAQAAWERSGAAQFNRAAAASLGALAAQSASTNIPMVEDLWDGPRGLFKLFLINTSETILNRESNVKNGVATSSLRLFPVNGFAQSTVFASAQLSKKLSGTIRSLHVEIPASSLSLLDGSRGGAFWNIRLAVASAWLTKDPMSLNPEIAGVDELSQLITVIGRDLPIGAVTIRATTSSASDQISLNAMPGGDFSSPSETKWQAEKWERLLGYSPETVRQMARELIQEGTSEETWNQLKKILILT